MKYEKYLIFAAWHILAGVPITSVAQSTAEQTAYYVRKFTPQDGLGSIQVRGIVQDKYGFIWFGSRDVISKFDGYYFKKYKFPPDELSAGSYSGGILNLYTDRKQNVWVHSELLSKYDYERDKFIHYKPAIDLTDITAVCFEPHEPIIWFGTSNNGLYSFNIASGETFHYQNNHHNSDIKTLLNSIHGLSDRGPFLLLATSNGLWQFDKEKTFFSRPLCSSKDSATLYHQPIWDIIDYPAYDPNDTWLYLSGKLVRLNQHYEMSQNLALPQGMKPTLHTRDREGMFWFATERGFYQIDPHKGTVRHLRDESSRLANYIFVDREQNLWSGGNANGAYQLVPRNIIFHTYRFDTQAAWTTGTLYQFDGKDRLVMIKGSGGDNEMWLASPIDVSAPKSVNFRKIPLETPPAGLIMNSTTGHNHVWFISWDSGVTGYPIDKMTGLPEIQNPVNHTPDETNKNTISTLTAGILEDSNKNLWVASRGSGISMILKNKKYGSDSSVTHYRADDTMTSNLSHDYCWDFFPEDKNSLWVISWTNIDLFRDGKFEQHFSSIQKPRCLVKLSNDTLIIGTYEGLYEAVKRGKRYMLIDTGMHRKYLVNQAVADNQGRLWFNDPKQNLLICYDRKERIAIEFSEQDGVVQPHFIRKSSNGLIAMGSAAGLTIFDPQSLKVSRRKTKPILTELLINNKNAPITSENRRPKQFEVKKAIGTLEELVLTHLHNNFRLQFSAMEMTAPEKNQYKYKLDGYDETWIESDWRNRTATYTNLDPGFYNFRVQATNHHGIWSEEEATVQIRVLPPPWQTWWAYSLYGLAFIALLQSWRRYDSRRLKLKHRAEHLSELDALKTRFFTNISHEFRTPITLILDPLKKRYNKSSTKEDKEELGIMLRNGQRLLRLINQLLDLSKIEAGKMHLQASPDYFAKSDPPISVII